MTMVIEGGPVRSATVRYAVEPSTLAAGGSVVTYTSDVTHARPAAPPDAADRACREAARGANLERLERRIAAEADATT